MRRREIIVSLAAGMLSRTAFAQGAPANVARIGFLQNSTASDLSRRDAFVAGMRERGLEEDRDFLLVMRFADGQLDRLPTLAAELAQENVAVIVAAGGAAVHAVQLATRKIPIVVPIIGDPVAGGYISSLAHPGGSVTGLSMNNSDISAKRLQLLRELSPGIARVVALGEPSMALETGWNELRSAAQSLRIELRYIEITTDDFEPAFALARSERAEAMIVLPTAFFNLKNRRVRLADLALEYRFPTIYEEKSYIHDGGLMSYGPDFLEMYRQSAGYVAKILQGAKPADLPFEQPNKYVLAINLKTAKTLGISIPQTLLVRADEVLD